MKILVFGKTGQVARALQQQGAVIALGRDQADLTDPGTCAALITESDADVVINAAAYTAVDQAEENEALAHTINAAAPAAMARAAAEKRIPFLHLSTDYVFDGSGTSPKRISDPVSPQNAYGRTKLAGEIGVREAGGVHVILRTSWVFSAHGSNFVKTMLRLSETHTQLRVVADQVGGPTPAADIASALMRMAQATRQGHQGGTYHFSGASDISWAGFAREIFTQAARDVQVTDISSDAYPTAATRPLNSRLHCGETETDFHISRPDWKAGLTHVLKGLSI